MNKPLNFWVLLNVAKEGRQKHSWQIHREFRVHDSMQEVIAQGFKASGI